MQQIEQLPLRADLRADIEAWSQISPQSEQKRIGKLLGLAGKTILLRLPTLRFPQSFPLDLMHCVLQNTVPLIFARMGGTQNTDDATSAKKDRQLLRDLAIRRVVMEELPVGPPQHSARLDKKVWINIGLRQENARRFIPSQLGQGPRRIDTRHKGYKAMEWEAFLVRDGPSLLADVGTRFAPYLTNFLLLRKIYRQAVARELTCQQLSELRFDCKAFIRMFEELYFEGKLEQMNACRINGHALLHLGKLIVT